MKNITKLNELIYAGAKLVCKKIRVPLKNTNRNSKPGWEIRLETKIRNLQQQAKMIKKRKNAGTCDTKEKAIQIKLTIQLKEINPKVLAKEGRLKRYQDWVKQYRQNWTFQNKEKNFTIK